MTDIDQFIESNKEQLVLFAERSVLPRINEFTTEYSVFKSLINLVSADMKFGDGVDRTHIMVASAMLHSLWCGWIAQEMVAKNQPNFDKENIQKFKAAIASAYEAGVRHATETPV
jgi:hypothetical protein